MWSLALKSILDSLDSQLHFWEIKCRLTLKITETKDNSGWKGPQADSIPTCYTKKKSIMISDHVAQGFIHPKPSKKDLKFDWSKIALNFLLRAPLKEE